MTKAEFVAKMAEKAALTRAEAEKALNALLETITATLKAGDKVGFTGFGTFAVVECSARRAGQDATLKLAR